MHAARLLALLAATAPLALAQDRTTEEGEASITDPDAECAPYSFETVTSNMANFPTIWQAASILSNDSEASSKWSEISGNVPTDIAVKTADTTYGDDDPDCWWTRSQCVDPKHNDIPTDIFDVAEPKTLGYGFDDGPNCSHNAFYDYLTEKNQKATMFYIGSNVMDWPLEAQRGVTDGHEICVHTWSHGSMTTLENEVAFAELWYTMKAIKLVTGVTPTCWRPPLGDVDDRIRAIADGLGLRTIVWKYDSFDWEVSAGDATADQVNANYQGLIDNVNNGTFDNSGAIMLTHEINNYTMQTAIDWYDRLNDAFDYIVPVGVGLNITKPYSDRDDIVLPTFEEYIGGDTSTDPSSASAASASASANPSGSSAASGDSSTGGDGALSLGANGFVGAVVAAVGSYMLLL